MSAHQQARTGRASRATSSANLAYPLLKFRFRGGIGDAGRVIDSAGLVNFHELVVLANTVAGARPLFEKLLNDVVALAIPRSAL